MIKEEWPNRMLHDFLENNIQNKLNILYVIQARKYTSIKELGELLHLSYSGVNSLVSEINKDLCGYALLRKESNSLVLDFQQDSDISILVHRICRRSAMLHCLKFFLTNDAQQPFVSFYDREFLSQPTAYRIRNSCREYLVSIGLGLQQNKVVGDEYRIRFLIALLYYKYGVDCGYFDSDSIYAARQFILETNQSISMNYLNQISMEHGYFECLFVLLWKRVEYQVKIPQFNHFGKLKEVFVYNRLKKLLNTTLTSQLHIQFSEDDLDYLYLIYLCTNNSMFADKWKPEDVEQNQSIIFADNEFDALVKKMQGVFGTDACTTRPFKATLVNFYKKCILELYCLIPDEHFYLYSQRNETTQIIYNLLSDIINNWGKSIGFQFTLDKSHLFYLSLQIEFILYQRLVPVPIYILSDLNAELEVMTLYLQNHFSSRSTSITPLLITLQNIEFLCQQKHCIIVASDKFIKYFSIPKLLEHNTFIPVSVEINPRDIQMINDTFTRYKKIYFLNYLSSLSYNPDKI